MRTVADRHRLAAYHNKQCWRAFQGYQHRWPWTTLKSKVGSFSGFFLRFHARRTFEESEFSPKLLEIDQDKLRMKLNWCCRASREHQLRFLVLSKRLNVHRVQEPKLQTSCKTQLSNRNQLSVLVIRSSRQLSAFHIVFGILQHRDAADCRKTESVVYSSEMIYLHPWTVC